MSRKYAPLTRRTFLQKSVTAAFIPAFWSMPVPHPGETPSASERRVLSKASPMIPPVPAILLTVKGINGGVDEISVVWTFVLNSTPPQIGLSVHEEHVARELINHHKQFVLNVPTTEIVDAFDMVDMSSKKSHDKFEATGLTRGRASAVDAPTVEESPIHVECKILNEVAVPPVRTLFIAEVVATTVKEGVCDEHGNLIVRNVPFFGMTPGSGEFFTMGEKVGYIGQTVGRDDIKY